MPPPLDHCPTLFEPEARPHPTLDIHSGLVSSLPVLARSSFGRNDVSFAVDETGRREPLECWRAAFWITKWNGRLNFTLGTAEVLRLKRLRIEESGTNALRLLDSLHSP